MAAPDLAAANFKPPPKSFTKPWGRAYCAMRIQRMSEGRPVADLSTLTCIEDLRVIAKRRVPRMFYDYADSGSYTQGTYRANEEAFQQSKLRQRGAMSMQGHTDDTGPAAYNQPLSE